ncbi:MAG: hypothetical protein ACI9LO_001464 [Planctomycetota bacterium]|jgi:hypothetical protein
MSTSIRLDDELVQAAEIEATNHKRSPPKQIEYWADIGRAVSRFASSSDLLALTQGIAQVTISAPKSVVVPAADVFEQLENNRNDGKLSQKIPAALYRFEASQTRPGLLDRVAADGSRQSGHFRNGEFMLVK